MTKAHRTIPELTTEDIVRFWNLVHVKTASKCWLWKSDRIGKYPNFKVKRVQYTATRVSYFIATSADPGSMLVCHKCDNPKCCNPSHLFVGTHKANRLDCAAKQRLNPQKGSKRPKAKLTESIVSEIKSDVASGIPQANLARKHKVSPAVICGIIDGSRWKHVKESSHQSQSVEGLGAG